MIVLGTNRLWSVPGRYADYSRVLTRCQENQFRFVPLCTGLEQSEIDAYSRVDGLYEMLVVNLRIVDIAADFMTRHFGCGVWQENIP